MLVNFHSRTVDDVTNAIQLLPDKQCVSNPIQTRLLKGPEVVAPSLVEVY